MYPDQYNHLHMDQLQSVRLKAVLVPVLRNILPDRVHMDLDQLSHPMHHRLVHVYCQCCLDWSNQQRDLYHSRNHRFGIVCCAERRVLILTILLDRKIVVLDSSKMLNCWGMEHRLSSQQVVHQISWPGRFDSLPRRHIRGGWGREWERICLSMLGKSWKEWGCLTCTVHGCRWWWWWSDQTDGVPVRFWSDLKGRAMQRNATQYNATSDLHFELPQKIDRVRWRCSSFSFIMYEEAWNRNRTRPSWVWTMKTIKAWSELT